MTSVKFLASIKNVVLKMFNNLRAWFVSVGNITFNHTDQLVIVCDSIHRLNDFARTKEQKECIGFLTDVIGARMRQEKQDKKFDAFLIKHKCKCVKEKKNG